MEGKMKERIRVLFLFLLILIMSINGAMISKAEGGGNVQEKMYQEMN